MTVTPDPISRIASDGMVIVPDAVQVLVELFHVPFRGVAVHTVSPFDMVMLIIKETSSEVET